MKKQIITTVALLLVIAGLLTGGILMGLQTREKHSRIDAAQQQLAQLDAKAAELETALAALTTADADVQTAQAQQLEEEARELQTQLDTLRGEIQTLQAYLDENQAAIDEVMAEVTYLQGVYDELKIGLEQVNGYIAEG